MYSNKVHSKSRHSTAADLRGASSGGGGVILSPPEERFWRNVEENVPGRRARAHKNDVPVFKRRFYYSCITGTGAGDETRGGEVCARMRTTREETAGRRWLRFPRENNRQRTAEYYWVEKSYFSVALGMARKYYYKRTRMHTDVVVLLCVCVRIMCINMYTHNRTTHSESKLLHPKA